MKTTIAALLLITTSLLPAMNSSVAVLKDLGPGARSLGAGQAFVATPTGVDGLWSNPATIGTASALEAFLAGATAFPGKHSGSVAAVMPLGESMVAAVQFAGMVEEGGAYVDEEGNELSPTSTGERDFLLSGAAAYRTGTPGAGTFFSTGGSIKLIQSLLADWEGTAVTADAGILVGFNKLYLGASGANLFGEITYRSLPNPLPQRWRAGIAYSDEKAKLPFLVAADLSYTRGNTILAIGAEIRVLEILALRAGGKLMGTSYQRISAGMGIALDPIAIDIAVASTETGILSYVGALTWREGVKP